MTNKQKIIQDVAKEIGIDEHIVSSIFQITNKKDWAIFCSQMGDYDYPQERIEARKILNDELVKLSNSIGKDVDYLKVISDKISDNEIYCSKFHSMSEEYVTE